MTLFKKKQRKVESKPEVTPEVQRRTSGVYKYALLENIDNLHAMLSVDKQGDEYMFIKSSSKEIRRLTGVNGSHLANMRRHGLIIRECTEEPTDSPDYTMYAYKWNGVEPTPLMAQKLLQMQQYNKNKKPIPNDFLENLITDKSFMPVDEPELVESVEEVTELQATTSFESVSMAEDSTITSELDGDTLTVTITNLVITIDMTKVKVNGQ